jgi:uncharacterized protein
MQSTYRFNRRRFVEISLAGMGAAARLGAARTRLRALIVDGANNHDWRAMTACLQAVLGATGRFGVDVATSPPPPASRKAWISWRPRFADYDVVVNNFNGGHLADGLRWPRAVEEALEEYVARGGGLANIHAANNGFLEWPAYNRMIGLGWREPSFGPSLVVEDSGAVRRIPAGQGRPPGHGPSHDFEVVALAAEHPIYRGLPPRWLHPYEQLTHGQHGPAENLTVLSYAWSKDTGENEPVDWTVDFDRGRVYTTMLGHTSTRVVDSNRNLRCVGFQTAVARGIEWAATGEVTLPAPRDFPGPGRALLNDLVSPNDRWIGTIVG